MSGERRCREDFASRLRSVFERHPEIEAVWLFGSQAEGRARPGSDIDLALAGDREALERHRLDLLADLTRAGFDRVDLVLLEGADPALRFEAVRPNCLIYARPGFDRGGYYSRVVREWFDFEPYLRIQREALKRRLLGGQP